MKKALTVLILASNIQAGTYKKDGSSPYRKKVEFTRHTEKKGKISGDVESEYHVNRIENTFALIKGKWTVVRDFRATDSIVLYTDSEHKPIRIYSTDRQLLKTYAAYVREGEQVAGKSKLLKAITADIASIKERIAQAKRSRVEAIKSIEEMEAKAKAYSRANQTRKGREAIKKGKITRPANETIIETREVSEKIKETIEALQVEEVEAKQELEKVKRS